jgi:hypothetical protein
MPGHVKRGMKSKKVQRMEKKSNKHVADFIEALKKKEASPLVFAQITKTLGGDRFLALVDKEEVTVKLSGTYHHKGAKADDKMNLAIAVHPGKYVLLDGGFIRAVVGAAAATKIMALMAKGSSGSKSASPKSGSSNNFFNRLGGARNTRKNYRW